MVSARYEGFECSDNVIYVGASPNHNVLPLVRYMLDNVSRHVFCVGSNYVWTWETNRVTRELVTAAQGSILAERLLELGESAVDHIVDESSAANLRLSSTRWSEVRATISSAPFMPAPGPPVSTFRC